jgi:DNA mismatch repair ATPase MutL
MDPSIHPSIHPSIFILLCITVRIIHLQRVQLLAVPFSKSISFGPEDVFDLASIIADKNGQDVADDLYSGRATSGGKAYLLLKNDEVSPSASLGKRKSIHDDANNDNADNADNADGVKRTRRHCRLPKLVSMFASRACRSAVMIGTALRPTAMQSIVQQLGGLEQPWNCPHGRPTIRHLIDFSSLKSNTLS